MKSLLVTCLLLMGLIFAGCATSASQNWTKEGASFTDYTVVVVHPLIDESRAHDTNASLDSSILTLKLAELLTEHLKKASSEKSFMVTTKGASSGKVLVVESKLASYNADPPRSTGLSVLIFAATAFSMAAGNVSGPALLANGPASNAQAAIDTTLADRQSGDVLARLHADGAASQNGWSQSNYDPKALGSAAVTDALDKTADETAKTIAAQ